MTGLRIAYSVQTKEGATAGAEIAAPQDAGEFHARIKSALLQWMASRPSGHASLTLFATLRRRDEALRALLADVCALWDADAELDPHREVRIEITLSHRGDSWIGCTNAASHYDPAAALREMRVIDYADVLAEGEALSRAVADAEKARRRAQPVGAPMEFPRGIASELASYLRLEYGESRWRKGSLKARDLVFAGEFVVDGVPTQYWSYPTSRGEAWATVERFDDHYALGFADGAPPVADDP